jgi:hypothetical protein
MNKINIGWCNLSDYTHMTNAFVTAVGSGETNNISGAGRTGMYFYTVLKVLGSTWTKVDAL